MQKYGGNYILQWDNKPLLLGIYGSKEHITHIFFNPSSQTLSCKTPLSDECASEIQPYLNGNLKYFSIPLLPQGSAFKLRVWEGLCNIPYGEVRSYKDIADSIASPKASRAVGNANHNNPLMILIPCHRVVRSNGALGGYALGVDIKARLLHLEQKYKNRI
mgnify:FL=1